MMIRQLPADVRSYLRSGVAVASVTQCVEELVLNAVDAGATCVAVRVDLAAFKVQVVDNGVGVAEDQLALMGERYATSKCHLLKDLNNLCYYGYRGEALASIRDSCGILEIMTRTKASSKTYCKMFQNGRALKVTESAIPRPSVGTTVTVHDLFSNFPVRRKSTNQGLELERIRQRLEALALLKPHVSVSLRNDVTGSVILQTHKCSSIIQTFSALFGLDKAKTLVEVSGSRSHFNVKGFIGKAAHTKKDLQFVFVNGRLVFKTKIHKCVNHAMAKSVIFKRNYGQNANTPEITQRQSTSTSPTKFLEKHPVYVLDVHCPLKDYDITFDPAKTLVEFKDWDSLLQCITDMVNTFLKKENLVGSPDLAVDPAKDTISTEKDEETLVGRISPTMLQGTLTSKKVKKRTSESSSSENPYKTPHTMSITEWKAQNETKKDKYYAHGVDSSVEVSLDDSGNDKKAETHEHDSSGASSMTSDAGDTTATIDKFKPSENTIRQAENLKANRDRKENSLLAEKKLSCFSKEKQESFLSVNKLSNTEKHANLQRQNVEIVQKNVTRTCPNGVKESSEPKSSLSLFRKPAAKPGPSDMGVSEEPRLKRVSTSAPQISTGHCLSSLQRFRKMVSTTHKSSNSGNIEEVGERSAAESGSHKISLADNLSAQPSSMNNPQRNSTEARQNCFDHGDHLRKRQDFDIYRVNVSTRGINKHMVNREPNEFVTSHINKEFEVDYKGKTIGQKNCGDINVDSHNKEVNQRMVVDEASSLYTDATAVYRDSRKRLNEVRDPTETKAAKLSRLVREKTSSVTIQPDPLLFHAKTSLDVQSLQAYQYKRPSSTNHEVESMVNPRSQYNPGCSTATIYHTESSLHPRSAYNQDCSNMYNKISRCYKEPISRSNFGISHQQPMSFSATHTDYPSPRQHVFHKLQQVNETHWGSTTEDRTKSGSGFIEQSLGETRQMDAPSKTSVMATCTDICDVNVDVTKQLLDTALSSAFYEQAKTHSVPTELDVDKDSEKPDEMSKTHEQQVEKNDETIQQDERSIGTALYRAVPMNLISTKSVTGAIRKDAVIVDETASNQRDPMDLATSGHGFEGLRQDAVSLDKDAPSKNCSMDIATSEFVFDAPRQDTVSLDKSVLYKEAPSEYTPSEGASDLDDHMKSTRETEPIADSEQFGISTQSFSPVLSQASLNRDMMKFNLNSSQGFTPVARDIESLAGLSDTRSVDDSATWITPKSEGFSPQLDISLLSPNHMENDIEGFESTALSKPHDQVFFNKNESIIQHENPNQSLLNNEQSEVQPAKSHTIEATADSFLSTCSQNTLDVTVNATVNVTPADDDNSHEGQTESNDIENSADLPVGAFDDVSVTQLLARASAVNTNTASRNSICQARDAVTFSDIFSPTQSDRITSSLCGKCHNDTDKNNACETSQELSNDVKGMETETELPDASWNTTWSSIKETEISKLDDDFDETFESVATPSETQKPVKCTDHTDSIDQQSEASCPTQCPEEPSVTDVKHGGVFDSLADEAGTAQRRTNPDTSIQENEDRSTSVIIKGCGKSVTFSSKPMETDSAEWMEMTDPQTGKQLFVNSKSGATVFGDNFKGHNPRTTEIVRLDRLFSAPGSVRLKPGTSSAAASCVRLGSDTSSEAGASPPCGDGPVAEMVADFLQQDKNEAEVKWRSPLRDLAQTDTSKVTSINTLFQEWSNPVLDCPEKEVRTAEVSGLPSRAVVNAYKSMHTCTFTKDMLNTVQVIGQLDKKFIACLIKTKQDGVDSDSPDLLAVIDQHAAHERVRLEMLTEEAYEDADKVRGQLCVYPVTPAKTLTLTEDEVRVMVTYREELKRIGVQFEVAAESRTTVHVRSVPDCLVVKAEPGGKRKTDYIYWETVEALIRDHVELLRSTSGTKGMFPKVIHKILCSIACHGAIKFGDPLTQRECEALVRDLCQCDLPFQCAHGRPSVMPMLQLEQLETRLKQQKPKPPKLHKLTEAVMSRKDVTKPTV